MKNTSVVQVKVWDVPVRLFHWLSVASFVLAYVSAEMHLMVVHVWIGYGLLALLLFRIVWGFIGSRYARFGSFVFSPQQTLAYVRSLRAGQAAHYYGHNPAGALMVFALLALLAAIFVSGLVTLAVIDYEGPLLFLANAVSDDTAYFFRHAHDFFVNVALWLIPLHLIGVVVGSLQHRENLVRAMVTGLKRKVPEEAKQH
ncbi:MAG: cytochrome b/b6 domain-containing protein [Sideroxyarcus sp.]|nr:cytochrome b/b6 domain-containing protein [Sideroxyarcus sp.]